MCRCRSRWRPDSDGTTVIASFCFVGTRQNQTTDDHFYFLLGHFPFLHFYLFSVDFLYLSKQISLLFAFAIIISLSLCSLLSGTETKEFGSNSKCHKSVWMLCECEVNSMTTSNMMIYHTQACVHGHMGMCYICQFCLHILVKMKKKISYLINCT